MKKILATMLCLFFGISCLALISACNAPADGGENSEHEHTFAAEWTQDDIYHWHDASCGDTLEIRDREKHDFGEWQTV